MISLERLELTMNVLEYKSSMEGVPSINAIAFLQPCIAFHILFNVYTSLSQERFGTSNNEWAQLIDVE